MMIIKQLISNEFTALKPSDSVQFALISMEDLGVMNLPVVNNDILLGYINYQNLAALDPTSALADVSLNPPEFLKAEHSLFKAIELFGSTQFDLLAVCTDHFQGVVWIKDVVRVLGRSTTTGNDGAVMILRCASHDYSVSQLGRMIESEDGKILGLWIWQPDSSATLEMMIKLNIYHIDNLTQMLEAKGYEVLHRINHRVSDSNEDRYLSLIKYLDI